MLLTMACAAAVIAELTLGAPQAVVDLRVYTYATLDPAGIAEARQLVHGLLATAGVQATWRLCGGPDDEFHGVPTTTRTVFVIRRSRGSPVTRCPRRRGRGLRGPICRNSPRWSTSFDDSECDEPRPSS